MNVRRSIAVTAATVMLGGGLAMAAPAAIAAPAGADSAASQVQARAEHWRNLWNADISSDYLKTHKKQWHSGFSTVPGGANMARGVFTCWGGGRASLKVQVSGGGSYTKTHNCNGKKHYATVAAKPGQAFNLVFKGTKDARIEAWVN